MATAGDVLLLEGVCLRRCEISRLSVLKSEKVISGFLLDFVWFCFPVEIQF